MLIKSVVVDIAMIQFKFCFAPKIVIAIDCNLILYYTFNSNQELNSIRYYNMFVTELLTAIDIAVTISVTAIIGITKPLKL